MAGAEARLRDARGRLGDDPEVAAEADRYLAQLREAQANHRMTASENRAIDEYNAGVRAANAAQYADAAAAFRRAAAAANREALRRLALQKALSMDLRARGERAVALARAGDVAQALALFQAMDRTSMSDEDRRWLDRNVTQLKRTGGR
jgi:tetratricopeptide (TPR) repeat protein